MQNARQQASGLVALNPRLTSNLSREFGLQLKSRVIGQQTAVTAMASAYQIFHAGMADPTRPIATMLFLGPTGSGKTHVVEAAAEILFGDAGAMVKVDCAEFQQSHEIAKLIGSPPGYLGHRETSPVLTQESIDKMRTRRDPFTLVLFDEIEKASDALWHLLLGILDKATLTLGDNRRVDFSQTMVFMTSNLGARQISELMTGAIGFAPACSSNLSGNDLGEKISRTATEAAKRNFSPEFINRIDKVVVFRSLKHEELRQILDLELNKVQRRIEEGGGECFTFSLTDRAKELLLTEGIDNQYGARHLKRAIERLVVHPLANLSASGQVRLGDVVVVDCGQQSQELTFYRDETIQAMAAAAAQAPRNTSRKQPWFDFKQRSYPFAGAERPIV
jgi:ATP-dependent Clp protease ATP-binding subunit ClpA